MNELNKSLDRGIEELKAIMANKATYNEPREITDWELRKVLTAMKSEEKENVDMEQEPVRFEKPKKCAELKPMMFSDTEIRYAVNKACCCSPLTIMINLMRYGRVWLQDRIIENLEWRDDD